VRRSAAARIQKFRPWIPAAHGSKASLLGARRRFVRRRQEISARYPAVRGGKVSLAEESGGGPSVAADVRISQGRVFSGISDASGFHFDAFWSRFD